ncbi:DUF803-domain-containing protein [Coprinopsis marcescibilis]|uniref:DUF803-domain-containing protein n=1 Tax=Coprinopsis marcescibilis TaxID=230819 RepID=A0A5C3KWQ4_COPMA|nr:DUF803-domain-containing protein [Coprinopsis marcescibilis]
MSSTISTVASATSQAATATSSAASGTFKASPNLKVVGVILAVASGVLIGSSFVLKKKGLIRSQAGGELGEGVAYLKSLLWWSGMILMILGELCNFAAYAFVEAIVVTPLGALSVVVSAVLSSIFLKEKLSFFGWLGCALCILGSVIIALNAPHGQTIGQIREFQKLFLAPGFLALISVLIVTSLVIVIYFAPRYGKNSMFWYISVCSMIGGISVSVTTGLGASIVSTAMGDNQFTHWFMYFLFGFVVITLLIEIYYLNIALALFNTAMVTPTYYVIFTFFTMVTTIVLFQGLKTTVTGIITIVIAFVVICIGITILQMSKVDPKEFNKLDRRSTLLLQAAKAQTEDVDEKGVIGIENPGMDTLRGSFGTVGSIIRARTMRRMSQNSRQSRVPGSVPAWDNDEGGTNNPAIGMKRHQLYDAPVPRFGDDTGSIRAASIHSQTDARRRPTIKFDERDLVHSYLRPGQGETATHEHRQAVGTTPTTPSYPPLPAIPSGDLIGSDLDALRTPSQASFTTNVAGIGSGGGGAPPPSSDASAVRGSTMVAPSSSVKDDDNASQLLSMSSLLSQEHSVHSAPATMYQRYRSDGLPQRKDSREIFERTPNPLRDTLLSFPSVTDSARSVDFDDDAIEQIKKGEEKEKQRKLKEKAKAGLAKRYPKSQDDTEESERLWHKSTLSESDSAPEELPPDVTGIRLVQRK